MKGHAARRQLDVERRRLEAARTLLLEQQQRAEITASHRQHQADAASDTYEQEVEASLVDAVERELLDIVAAEARIDDGTYGACERCGQPIGEERLRAIPWATRCLADQEVAEEPAVHVDRV
jgi:DnaK suppressor protein